MLFSKVPLKHPNLPGIGPIAGYLDFLTAGIADPKSVCHHQSIPHPSELYLLVAEDKQTSPIGKAATLAKLLSQLIILDSFNLYEKTL